MGGETLMGVLETEQKALQVNKNRAIQKNKNKTKHPIPGDGAK